MHILSETVHNMEHTRYVDFTVDTMNVINYPLVCGIVLEDYEHILIVCMKKLPRI
jgi:hypothetical protein